MKIKSLGATFMLSLVFPTTQALIAQSPSTVAAPNAIYGELAGVIVNDTTTGSEIDKLATALIENMNATDPDFADMETTYPGITDALINAMKPLLREAANRTTPLYRAELEQFYSRNLSEAEARAFVDFMVRPGTRRFYEEVRRQNSYKATTKELLQDRDADQASIDKDIKNAARKAATELSAAEQNELEAFFKSPLGLKLQSLNAAKAKIDAKWFNYSPPDLEDRMGKAVLEAMIGHIAKTDQATADAMRKELAKELR